MTVYMAGPDGAPKEFADEAEAAEFRRALREAEPPLLKRLRYYRNQVFYLQQKAARAVSERRGRAWALGEIESELRGINNWMMYDIGEAEREGVPANVTDPREHSAHVVGVGVVRIKGARCACARPFEPRDFEAIDDNTVRAVCPHCHTVTLQIELEDDSDED
jgi:hypothetical protein